MTKFQIDIVSDVVCPWCYIGHRRLTTAITAHKSLHPTDTFKLTYHPYYLNPPSLETLQAKTFFPVTPPSRLRSEAYASKFGPDVAPQIFQRLSTAAAADGLHFKFGGKTGPSRNGHRLIRYAQSHGGEDAQNQTMLGLWKRYYEQEIDITELEVLVQVGVEAGLGSADEIRNYLEAKGDKRDEALRDVKAIDRETEDASLGRGISGVPNYEIGVQGFREKYEVSGAQDPKLFGAVFAKFRELDQVHGGLTPVDGAGTPSSRPDGKTAAAAEEEMNGEACAIDGSGKC